MSQASATVVAMMGRDDPSCADQIPRLAAFRAAHPGVLIHRGEFGTWEARIPEPDGERFAVRPRLGELLDRVAELLGEQ
jgi:hypothetical protein